MNTKITFKKEIRNLKLKDFRLVYNDPSIYQYNINNKGDIIKIYQTDITPGEKYYVRINEELYAENIKDMKELKKILMEYAKVNND